MNQNQINLNKSVLISAGGTGGHIIPALRTARRILKENSDVKVFISGVGTEIEKKLLSEINLEKNLEYVIFKTNPVLGKSFFYKLKSGYSYLKNFFKCITFLRDKKIKLIFGFGGYPSFLPMISGFFSRIPIYVFEQNGKAGLANKVLSYISTAVLVVPECEDLKSKNLIKVLNPVREEILKISSLEIDNERNLESKVEKKILILGGSQGAVSLNNSFLDNLDLINSTTSIKVSIWHQTGERDFDRVSALYKEKNITNVKISKFIDNIAEALSWSNLIISRAGASTVAELLCVKRPVIFLPLPVAGGHQVYNIKKLISSGGAILVSQDEHASKNLRHVLTKIFNDQDYITNIKNNLNNYLSELTLKRADEVISNLVGSNA